MDLEFTFVSEPMPYGRFANKPRTEKVTQEAQKRRRKNSIPKWITRKLRDCRFVEPHCGAPECKATMYRRVCPVETCEYTTGRYISHRSALLALLGHLRWVHDYG